MTISDIKRKNKSTGHHFFDKDTLRFFKSVIFPTVYGDGYFVTRETNPSGSTRYSVRKAESGGGIKTIGEFHSYRTLDGARERAKFLARHTQSNPRHNGMNPMTLRQWERKFKEHASRLGKTHNFRIAIHASVTSPAHRALFGLSDYAVDGVSGGTTWLRPKRKNPIKGRARLPMFSGPHGISYKTLQRRRNSKSRAPYGKLRSASMKLIGKAGKSAHSRWKKLMSARRRRTGAKYYKGAY